MLARIDRCESPVNEVNAEPTRRRAETNEKAPRTSSPERLRARESNDLGAVEDVRADLFDPGQAPAPRRSDIIGVIPQDVGRQARHRRCASPAGRSPAPCATRRDSVSTAGNRPLRTNENCHGCLTVAHQLGGYLPDAARFMTTRATASWPSSDFAARLEIDRGREAVGLLVERGAGAVAVDQRVERPAGAIEPGGLASRSTEPSLSVTDCAGWAWTTLPLPSVTAVVVGRSPASPSRRPNSARARRAAWPTDQRRRRDRGLQIVIDVGDLLRARLARAQRQHEQPHHRRRAAAAQKLDH